MYVLCSDRSQKHVTLLQRIKGRANPSTYLTELWTVSCRWSAITFCRGGPFVVQPPLLQTAPHSGRRRRRKKGKTMKTRERVTLVASIPHNQKIPVTVCVTVQLSAEFRRLCISWPMHRLTNMLTYKGSSCVLSLAIALLQISTPKLFLLFPVLLSSCLLPLLIKKLSEGGTT